jgi:small-conductance mechanosensitive channel
MNLEELFNNPVFLKLLHTLIITVIIFIVRKIAKNRLILSSDLDVSAKRKWVVTSKNIAFFTWIFVIVIIWINQLQAIGATMVVFAAAIVVATKEFILNIVGYFFRSGTKSFSIGDRIEINTIRGDVLDQNITGITLLEVGSGVKTHQYTGTTVFIPNALFLTQPVKNETMMGGEYVFHIITVNLKLDEDWQVCEKALLDAANEVCKPYIGSAIKQMTYMSKKHALDQPGVEPRINIQVPEHDRITLQLRIPVSAKRRGRIEADIFRQYLLNREKINKNEEKNDELKI